MSNLVRTNTFHSLQNELRTLSYTATASFCRLGEIMKEIHDNELWKGQYDSFEAFFSDPEFAYKKSSVYHSMKLVETFPKWKELVDVPVSKLIMITPHLDEDNREDMVDKARSLSTSDLYVEIGEAQGFTAKNLPKVYRCNICEKVKGVKAEELCTC